MTDIERAAVQEAFRWRNRMGMPFKGRTWLLGAAAFALWAFGFFSADCGDVLHAATRRSQEFVVASSPPLKLDCLFVARIDAKQGLYVFLSDRQELGDLLILRSSPGYIGTQRELLKSPWRGYWFMARVRRIMAVPGDVLPSLVEVLVLEHDVGLLDIEIERGLPGSGFVGARMIDSVQKERNRLMGKKYAAGLTGEEEDRLVTLHRELDRREEAQIGPHLSRLEVIAERLEPLVEECCTLAVMAGPESPGPGICDMYEVHYGLEARLAAEQAAMEHIRAVAATLQPEPKGDEPCPPEASRM